MKKKCCELCRKYKISCPNEDCPMFIYYEEDLNCAYEAIRKNGAMTLEKIGQRMQITAGEVRRIETTFLKRARKLFNKEKEFVVLKDYL